MPAKKPTAVVTPNLGLFVTRPNIAVPERALQSGLNFRVHNGRLESIGLGWTRFGAFQLNGRVRLIDNFFPKNGGEHLIFGTQRDLYRLTDGNAVVFLTPRFEAGTAEVDAADPAVVTFSETSIGDSIKAGDKIAFGTAGVTDPAAVWYEIDTIDGTSTATLTTDVTGAPLAAGPFTARRLFAMDDTDWWDVNVFVEAEGEEDVWIATNGVDWVISWNGAESQVIYHSEMNFTCRALANYRNMIIYGNLLTNGEILATQIINSDVGAPFNAGDAGTGLSEQFTIHGGSDQILAMEPLQDSLIAYSEKHTVAIDFVGDPEVFAFRQSGVDNGLIGPKALVNFEDYHLFIGSDAMYHYDGVSHEEIDSHFWPEMLRQQDPTRKLAIFTHVNRQYAEVYWAYPLTTDPGSGSSESPVTVAQVGHYLENSGEPGVPTPYSRRAFPFTAAGNYSQETGVTWDMLTQPWTEQNFRWNDQSLSAGHALTIVGDNDGYIYTLNTAQTGDGEVLPSFVRMGRKALVDGRARGLLKRFYPFFEALQGEVEVTIQLMDHAQGPATTVHMDAFDSILLPEKHFTSPFRRGRFLEFEVGSDAGIPWILAGYDFDAAMGGRR